MNGGGRSRRPPGPAGPVGGPGFAPTPHRAGLCGACRETRLVRSARGSRFYLCRRSERDADYPRYPPLPVVRCPGFRAGRPADGEGAEEDER